MHFVRLRMDILAYAMFAVINYVTSIPCTSTKKNTTVQENALSLFFSTTNGE